MHKNKSVQRLDSLNNAADYAGVHVKTIRRWISAGRLTGYRLGPRLIKVDLDQLDAMLQPIGGHV
jgi:excisionase family DNA binding protein